MSVRRRCFRAITPLPSAAVCRATDAAIEYSPHHAPIDYACHHAGFRLLLPMPLSCA